MGYYVLGDQGQKYGPADVATLNLWISEGRVLPSTLLEDETSGLRSSATAVRGLQFPATPNPVLGAQAPQYQQPQQPQQPYQQPQQPYQPQQFNQYQRPQQYFAGNPGEALYKRALTLAAISVVLSIVFSIAGIATGIGSLINAIQAKSSGHPKATTAIIVSAAALAFYVIVHIVKFGMAMQR